MATKKLQLRFDATNASLLVREAELAELQPRVNEVHAAMEARQGPSATRGGWLHLPSSFPQEILKRLTDTADEIRDRAQVFVVVGIGGSYLGGRAAIEFLGGDGPQIIFAGQHLGSDALAEMLKSLEGRSVYVNVISREGTTVETGVAFRLIWNHLQRVCDPVELRRRIIVTTRAGSPLQGLASARGYRSFEVPDNVGGRYSAFTPVVLLPCAVAGADVSGILEGGAVAEEAASAPSLSDNTAYRYAAIRKLLYDRGKVIEVLATFDPTLQFIGQWWRQLAGESEGKSRRGIFPATVDYTTDLHSMGQWMQQGRRNVFETFVLLGRPNNEVEVPVIAGADDRFDYLAGKQVSLINRFACQATARAHLDGGVPNMTFELPARTSRALGEFFYVLMRAIAMTAFLSGVNPFDEPGVNDYKKVMYELLGRPA